MLVLLIIIVTVRTTTFTVKPSVVFNQVMLLLSMNLHCYHSRCVVINRVVYIDINHVVLLLMKVCTELLLRPLAAMSHTNCINYAIFHTYSHPDIHSYIQIYGYNLDSGADADYAI